jgi:hypothetical protein
MLIWRQSRINLTSSAERPIHLEKILARGNAATRSTLPAAAPLRDAHFFPDALFFFPVVERFAVDFVNGGFGDAQFARLHDHKEIDVVDFSVGALHIDTGEVFIAAETREPVIVDFDQIEREVFPLIWDMKFVVGGFRGVAADEPLKPVRNVRHSRFSHRSLRSTSCRLRQLLRLGLLRSPRVFLREERQNRCKQQSNEYLDRESCTHDSEC